MAIVGLLSFSVEFSLNKVMKTSQELRMLSSVTLNCRVTKIIMNSGSQLSVSVSHLSPVSVIAIGIVLVAVIVSL